MEEIWKEIVGFEGRYWVSTFGNVRNNKKILKGLYNKAQPYPKYHLTGYDGMLKYAMGHRLVAEAFLPNPHNYPLVHHKDNNPKNNKVDNLEWCTYSQNTKYAIEQGRFTQVFSGDKNPVKRFSDRHIEAIKDLKSLGWTLTELNEIFDCSRSYLSEILNGKKRIN